MAGTLESKYVATSDGVKLHYVEAGTGQTLLMLHSWSGNVEQFKHQIEGLSGKYHCIAIDMRGHGDSEKPDYGYKIQRLAKDVYDVFNALDLNDVTLLGHSMGCSVAWCYWDLFGSERVRRLILVDEPPVLTSNPAWSEAELEASGAVFDTDAVVGFCNTLAGPEGEAATREIFGGLFTKTMDAEEKDRLVDSFLKLPLKHSSTLFFNHSAQDWRDVIPRINVPTLVVGGRVSIVPWKSQEWISSQIPGSQLEIFEEEEGGNHFLFVEQPNKFNRIVSEFIG